MTHLPSLHAVAAIVAATLMAMACALAAKPPLASAAPGDVTGTGAADGTDAVTVDDCRQARRLGGIAASGGMAAIWARDAADGTPTLFLPSHPALSEVRIRATDQSGKTLPMLVSGSEDGPGRLVIDPMPVTSALPAPSLAELSETGETCVWVRTGPGTEGDEKGDAGVDGEEYGETGEEDDGEIGEENDEEDDEEEDTEIAGETGWETGGEPVTGDETAPGATRLRIMRSSRTESVFIETGLPRDYVEAQKGNEADGTVSVTSPSGATLYDGTLSRITGRGNATWPPDKKPFNMRLAGKADLAGSGEPHRSWCLLADAYDPTDLRNLVSLRLAKALGVAETPDCVPVDLWWNGEYRGSYLLTEKIGVWPGGVDAADLDKAHKRANAANPETARAYDEDIVEEGTGPTGMATCYATGVLAPGRVLSGDLSGLLVEHDLRDDPGACWFDTSVGRFIIKEPDVASQGLVEAAQELFEQAFSCLYAGGEDDLGRSSGDYFDLGTLARCSWLYAVAGEADYMRCSSSYFFVGDDGLIHAGPAWDFDLSWANRPAEQVEYADPDYGNDFETQVLGEGNDELRRLIADRTNPRLSHLVGDVLLGGTDATDAASGLRSLSWYAMVTEPSHRMDRCLWDRDDVTQGDALATFREGLRARVERAGAVIRGWYEEGPGEDGTDGEEGVETDGEQNGDEAGAETGNEMGAETGAETDNGENDGEGGMEDGDEGDTEGDGASDGTRSEE